MQFHSFDLNLLTVFEEIYAELNLTRAAQNLRVTQPAVSNALSRLRQALSDPLFVRMGRSLAPTPYAQQIIGPVRQALSRLRLSLEQRTGFDPASSDRIFHIALRDTVAVELMPSLMRGVAEEAPHIRIQCHLLDRAEIAHELAAGTLDFAIDIPELLRADLLSMKLSSDSYVCAMRKDHPAAKGRLTLERFLALRMITISGRRRGRSLVDLALSRIGMQANSVLRLPYYQPAFHIVMASDLVMAAPYGVARQYDLALRALPFEAPVLQSRLFWHRHADADPGVLWFKERIGSASAASERARAHGQGHGVS
ncbi:MAG: LysR family transcriptional regulator [Alphaproteobacteria bacterium]|nr:LysR family transcriptional regulator [Alphaproteobacteria bacterium]